MKTIPKSFKKWGLKPARLAPETTQKHRAACCSPQPFAHAILANTAIVVRPFSHMSLPGSVRDVLTITPARYARSVKGVIRRVA